MGALGCANDESAHPFGAAWKARCEKAQQHVGMIVADTDVQCDVLSLEDFERLGVTHPNAKIKLLENLSLCLCHRLRTTNRKLSVYD